LNQAGRNKSKVTRRSLLAGAAAGGAGALIAAATPSPAQAATDPSQVPLVSPPPVMAPVSTGVVREYWLQVDSFDWNLCPSGRDDMMGTYVLGSSFMGLGYRAFTPNFGAPLPGNDDIGPNLGIPGPTMRANVGDRVVVHLRNNDTYYGWPHSLHVHGWRYKPKSDGAWTFAEYPKPGVAIGPGHDYLYEFMVPADSVGTWPYHDHSVPRTIAPGMQLGDNEGAMGTMELAAQLGMLGTIVVTDANTSPVDREIVLFFHDMYASDVPALAQDFDCFNGRSFLSNTPEFRVNVGDRVRWRIAALGQELHVFHLHGHRWHNGVRFVDSDLLGPSTTLTVEYTEDNPGSWLYHCHVTEHMAGGMMGWYHVDP
jgi:FtsP/CotA-like multicopper oxidase with cupredoxin domain